MSGQKEAEGGAVLLLTSRCASLGRREKVELKPEGAENENNLHSLSYATSPQNVCVQAEASCALNVREHTHAPGGWCVVALWVTGVLSWPPGGRGWGSIPVWCAGMSLCE